MIRKWMSVLLALMLAVMMPVCAMAEALQHTLTIVPGDFIAAEPAIADLLDVLAITVTPGEKSGALNLTLGDTDIVTAALGADTTALYAYSSELLGETVVHVTWDDAFELIKGLVSMQMYNENVDTAGIESIMSQIDLYKQQLIAAIGGEIQVNTGMVSKEEAMAQLGEVLGEKLSVERRDGEGFYRVEIAGEPTRDAQVIFKTMLVGLQSIEKGYPKFLKVAAH